MGKKNKHLIFFSFLLAIILLFSGCMDSNNDEDEYQAECVIQKPGSDDYSSIYTFNGRI
jgi:hypothetical protein